jgi:hypothetical protein
LLSFIVRYGLVKVVPDVMRELAFSQPSFGSLDLKTMHRMLDDYLVKARIRAIVERTVGRKHLENLDAARANSAEARVDSAKSFTASILPQSIISQLFKNRVEGGEVYEL